MAQNRRKGLHGTQDQHACKEVLRYLDLVRDENRGFGVRIYLCPLGVCDLE